MAVGRLVRDPLWSYARSCRPRRALSCLIALLGTVGLGIIPATATAPPPLDPYVALGDSYTAGPLIPNQILTSGLCERSDHNYPSLVAVGRGVTAFRDMSCGGATTGDMADPQRRQGAPAQFDGLTSDTRLVTIGIGVNDIGLLDIAVSCSTLGLLDPSGSPCRDYYTLGGTDRNAAAIAATAPRVAAVLDGIHRRSPRARMLVIGYPDILPQAGPGCWPSVPIAAGDLPYLRSVEESLNRMLAAQAAIRGARYVDTYTSSIGHDVCQAAGVRWLEWLQPNSGAAPVHPNQLAMQNDARQILAALGRG